MSINDKLTAFCVVRNLGTGSSRMPGFDNFIDGLISSFVETAQTDLLLHLCDDGSSDDTYELCMDAYENKSNFIELHHEPESRGLGWWCRKFVDGCKTPYFLRFDGDVIFESPGWDRRLVEYWDDAPPDCHAIGGTQIESGSPGRPSYGVQCFGDTLFPHYRHMYKGWHPAFLEREVANHWPQGMVVQSIMGAFCSFRTEAVRAVGGYDPAFDRLRGETEDLHLLLLLNGGVSLAFPGLAVTHFSDAKCFTKKEANWPLAAESFNVFIDKWGFPRSNVPGDGGTEYRIRRASKYPLFKKLCDYTAQDLVPMIACWPNRVTGISWDDDKDFHIESIMPSESLEEQDGALVLPA